MVVQRIDYDEYGSITYDSNPDFQPFKYADGLYDSQTKLIRFGFRDYEPNSGRWTTKDPIGFCSGQSNIYEYCFSNPINNLDPSGLKDVVKKAGPHNTILGKALFYAMWKASNEGTIPIEVYANFLNNGTMTEPKRATDTKGDPATNTNKNTIIVYSNAIYVAHVHNTNQGGRGKGDAPEGGPGDYINLFQVKGNYAVSEEVYLITDENNTKGDLVLGKGWIDDYEEWLESSEELDWIDYIFLWWDLLEELYANENCG